ncbi:MAG TPA: hypothetical protein PKM25_03600, partial [Candidatus Ozemobacteraceae bacterium]|nr:hypothetical protein [Candidatus Ozemobacteraceae bacterium]
MRKRIPRHFFGLVLDARILEFRSESQFHMNLLVCQMLSDWQISKAVKKGKLKISPFNIQNVNPNSYDITLGGEFYPMDMDNVIDPRKPFFGGSTVNTDEYIIHPGEHVLGHTI